MKTPKLLNIDANPKTVKGRARGYMTAVLYMAPHNAAGATVCPMAERAGCAASCLNSAGRAAIAKGNATVTTPTGVILPDNSIQRARYARTRLYWGDREGFYAQLIKELRAFICKADKAGLIPAVRLNGTSDIQWENESIDGQTIFDIFPDVQFYDYTKIYKRFSRPLPGNYHLTLSYSAAQQSYALATVATAKKYGANLAVVFRDRLPETFYGLPVVDGDSSDLRFLDTAGVVVGLKAKGNAKKDASGFVVDDAAAFQVIGAA